MGLHNLKETLRNQQQRPPAPHTARAHPYIGDVFDLTVLPRSKPSTAKRAQACKLALQSPSSTRSNSPRTHWRTSLYEKAACENVLAWAERVGGDNEKAIANAYVGEFVRTLRGGIDLGACESVPLADSGITEADLQETILLRPRSCATERSTPALRHGFRFLLRV